MKKLERDWTDVLWLVSEKLPWLDRIKLPLVCKTWTLPHQTLAAFTWNRSPSQLLTFWDPETSDWVKLNACVPGKVSFSCNGLFCLVRQKQLSVVNLAGEVVKSSPIPTLPLLLKRPTKKASRVTRGNSTFVLRDEMTGGTFGVMYTTFKEDSWTRWLVLDIYDVSTSKWSRHTHWIEVFIRARTPGVAVKGCEFSFLVEGPDAQEFSLISFDVRTQLWKVVSISGHGNLHSFVPNLVVWGNRLVTVGKAPGGDVLEVKEIDTTDEENVKWMSVKTKDDEQTREVLNRDGRFLVVSDGWRIFIAQTSRKFNGEVIIALDFQSRQWKSIHFQAEYGKLRTCFNLLI